MKKYSAPLSKKNRGQIAVQTENWRKTAGAGKETLPLKSTPFITISRQFGCGAFPLAEAIAEELMKRDPEKLPWAVYDKALVEKIAQDHQMSEEIVSSLGKKLRSEMEESALGLFKYFTPELKIYRSMVQTLRALAQHGRVIIVGRGGAILTKDLPGGFHLRLIAPLEWRAERVAELFKLNLTEAKEYTIKMDAEREGFLRKYLNADAGDPTHYHMILNNARLTLEQKVKAVAGAVG